MGPEGLITAESLCNFMQESAWNHADNLGLGFHSLKKDSRIWLLTRLYLEMNTYPEWGDSINIETWPSGLDRLFAYRDFQINSEPGEKLGGATSSWIIINKESKKPVNLNSIRDDMTITSERRAVSRYSGKIQGLDSGANDYQFRVRYSDLDVNGHVNNVQYIKWILDGYGPSIREKSILKSIEINFLKEVFMDDELVVKKEKILAEKQIFRNNIIRLSDKNEVCRAELEWKEV